MIKKYTQEEYSNKAYEANQLNKKLYVYTHEEETEETKTVVEYDDDGTPHETEVTETKTEEVAELLLADSGYYVCYKNNWTDGTVNPDFDTDRINALKSQLNEENTRLAKLAVENGFVEFKNAQFETNAQTVGDLTATMLLMQASGIESYSWLSKDDKIVELSLADFGSLGGLIAGFKAHIWNEEYLGYKNQIDGAQSYEELKEIEIEY